MDFERPVVELEERLEELKKHPAAHQPDIAKEIKFLEAQMGRLKKRVYSNLTAWQKVQISRHPERPPFSAYLDNIFHDFIELHGDRSFGDDQAIVGGLAKIDGRAVMVVGQEKGRGTHGRLKRNFGMAHPEGYRKAGRLYKLAGKFGLPLVTFIDTPGAYAGIGAEERGQAGAIAECLRTMSSLPVPIVTVNIGEGGSGGALALGVTDRFFMLENAYYSVITPEGCAAILWQEKEKAPEAAEALRLTADQLVQLGIIDGIIPEPLGGAHRDPQTVARQVGDSVIKALGELSPVPAEQLKQARYDRFRRIGVFSEGKESDERANRSNV
ncbi:MAG: acetyl-CoA carboxylase carboxyltransferase subunit alpha [Actinomycetota bacterium]|nr:acetyl-CoA carboxylase carboxyltransferase subunit alpha [Actinomycetota bacterium]